MTASSDVVERAWRLASAAHLGQVDKIGLPYILHPNAVALAVAFAGYSDEAIAVAWLHDVVEDTDFDLDDLRAIGFSERVVAAVDAITKRKNEPLPNYYARVLANNLAHIVKWFDVGHNSSPNRLAQIADEIDRRRMTKKYTNALAVLVGPPVEEIQ